VSERRMPPGATLKIKPREAEEEAVPQRKAIAVG
jgi:hypothetical protein